MTPTLAEGQGGTACAVFGFMVLTLYYVPRLLAFLIGKMFGTRPRPQTTRLEAMKARRERTGFCARCGYDLTGNVSGVCPECGTPTKVTG